MTAALQQLAARVGLGTDYVGFDGDTRGVSEQTLQHILTAMDLDVSSEAAIHGELHRLEDAAWQRRLPSVTVLHQEQEKHLPVHVPHGADVSVVLTHQETAQQVRLVQVDHWVEPRDVAGVLIGRATFLIPAGLELGWYTAEALSQGAPNGSDSRADVVVTPARAEWTRGPGPLPLGQRWGGQAQLYACTSERSWGIGDFADAAFLASQLAHDGAAFLLINPVHAANMSPNVTASPYSPTSRRFVDPQYVRPEDTAEYRNLTDGARQSVNDIAGQARTLNQRETIDRDTAWALKVQALWLLFSEGMSRARRRTLDKFVAEHGAPLEEFAKWCVTQDDRFPAEFYSWLQLCAREQLAAAQATAVANGMDIGIVQDLAVGVDARSADADLLGDVLARGVNVGAPPDMFNQLGQDWGQPPWHPQRLVEQSYKPFWDVLHANIAEAGGLRIDHILGFFRLWWVPSGQDPEHGAYVYYDHEAMIGLALLAAHNSGAVLIGEDLGTFEPWVSEYLAARGLLGTTIYFFENDSGVPRPTQHYRQQALASVTTHDLPPSAGYVEGEHIRLRAELDLLVTTVEEEEAALAAQRQGLLGRARELGVVPHGDGEGQDAGDVSTEDLVVAAHKDLLGAPSRLLGVSVVDLVGQRQVQNQPGTSWQYRNWCVPLANPQQRISLEVLREQPAYRAIVGLLSEV